MITASNEFITAVEQTSRQWSARFVLNGEVLDCDISKITCYKGSCGNDLAVGCVYAPYIEATLRRCNTNIDGETLTYQVGVNTGADYDYIDVGKFTVMDPSAGNGSVTFTGVGTLGRVGNNAYSTSLTYPATISAICNELAATISGATIRFQGFTSTDTSCTVATAITGQIRDVLGTIAGLLGGFVAEDNAGNIVIAKYNSGGTFSILPHRTLDIPKVRETPFSVLGIHITVAEATQDEEGQTIPEVYYEYGTPVIFQTNAWMTQALFNRLVTNFVGLVFDLSSIDIALGDPRIEPWDVISLTDLAGNTHSIPCFSITHTYDGGFTSTVEAVVESANTSSVRVKGALEKYVERLDSDVYAAKTAAAQAKASADEASRLVGEIEEDVDRATTLLGNMEAAAEQAGTTLTQIYQLSVDAGASAREAKAQAQTAENYATEAKNQATVANKYANAAIDQISIVEDVIGVLTWASEHGTFTLTTDTTVQDGKVYFTYDSTTGDYVPVVSPASNPHSAGYYELSVDEAMDSFIMSHLAVTSRGLWVLPNGMGSASDAQYAPNYKVLLSNNGMYVYDGSGALVSTFGENITFSATRAQKIGGANNYIEFDPTTGYINIVGDGVYFGSMAVGNIATHEEAEALGAIADELDARLEGVETQQNEFEQTTAENLESIRGLQTAFENEALDAIKALQNAQSNFALMSDLTALQTFINEYLGTDGYITAVNSGSNPYLEIGKSIGSSSFFVRISSTEMGFYQNGKRVAYINSSQLYITNSEVLNEQRVGDFLWRVNGTNRMSLVYSPKTT